MTLDVATRKVDRKFEGHKERVWWADWSPDGKRLASCAEDGTVRLWDAATGKGVGQFYRKGEQAVNARTITFSPDGRTLAGVASWVGLLVWDVQTGKVLPADKATPKQRYAFEGATSPDGTLLARAWYNRVEVKRLKDHELLSPPEGRYVIADSVAISPDGRTMLTEEHKVVRLWDVRGRKVLHRIEGDFGNNWRHVSASVFRPDGKTAVVLGQQHRLYEIDVRKGKAGEAVDFDSVNSSHPHYFALSADGSTLAQSYGSNAGGGRPYLALYETAKGGRLKRWEEVGSWYMAFSPDGKVLAEAGGSGLLFRDLKTGKELRTIELPAVKGMGVPTRCLSFSPDGRTVGVGCTDGTIRFHDVRTGKEKGRLEGHRGPVKSLSFTADGKTLASASEDSTALIWDVARAGKGKDK